MLDPSPWVHALLADARHHARARRYLAAVKAYQTADDLYHANGPAIREARRRAEEEKRREKRRADRILGAATVNALRRRVADALAEAYVERARDMRLRSPNPPPLRATARSLNREPPKGQARRSPRQILRYLLAAGLK